MDKYQRPHPVTPETSDEVAIFYFVAQTSGRYRYYTSFSNPLMEIIRLKLFLRN